MAELGKYTDTDAVRACLGIDAQDCPDAYMVDSLVEVELTVALDDWLPTHETIYTDGKAAAATDTQKRQKSLLGLYSQWFCAAEMSARLLTFLRTTSDGKNQAVRYDVDLEKVRKAAEGKMAKYQGVLDVEVNGASDTSTSPGSLLSLSLPTSDTVLDT
jgi:hypothetical protein